MSGLTLLTQEHKPPVILNINDSLERFARQPMLRFLPDERVVSIFAFALIHNSLHFCEK